MQKEVETALGFRVVLNNNSRAPYLYWLDPDGQIIGGREALLSEWKMWQLLNTPQEGWASAFVTEMEEHRG